MRHATVNFLKKTPLIKPMIFLKGLFVRPDSQNEESEILTRILEHHSNIPKRFIEFGFSGWEFNCASLISQWEGLLVDGDSYNVSIAKTILPRRIVARTMWLTLETMPELRNHFAGRELGILSVDVDGNDYWFLESLIDLNPCIIIAEYNAALGRRPITVPYEPQFNRLTATEDGAYYGASLSALTHLAESRGYRLVSVTRSGINAFFLRADLMKGDETGLDAGTAFVEKPLRNGRMPSDFWPAIAHLPFVDVTAPGKT